LVTAASTLRGDPVALTESHTAFSEFKWHPACSTRPRDRYSRVVGRIRNAELRFKVASNERDRIGAPGRSAGDARATLAGSSQAPGSRARAGPHGDGHAERSGPRSR